MTIEVTTTRSEETRDAMRSMLHDAKAMRVLAMQRYHDALVSAREEGWNNSQIARAVGVSEAAIRLYWRRHNLISDY
jgi:DNA-binding NarL/FixJ family response regulator